MLHPIAAFALLAALLAPAGARAGPGSPCDESAARRAAAAGASLARSLASVVPPDTSAFVLFGWVSPPADSTTEARIAEMAGIGFDLAVPAWLDAGCAADNLARMGWAAAHGMRCIVWDSRLVGALEWLPTFEDTLDQIVADYRDHPGLWGYYLGDEPPPDKWELLARLREALRRRDPTHPGWDNLVGRAGYGSQQAYLDALRDYSELFRPAVLSVDHYDFHAWGDQGGFVLNLAGVRAVARELGIPFWNIVQLIPHFDLRPLAAGELRWQVSVSLAMGVSGIGYFTYWTPDPDPVFGWQPAIIGNDGVRTPWYDFLAGFDRGVRAAGDRLVRSRHRSTRFAGSVPAGGEPFAAGDWIAEVAGRAAIGEFEGTAGERLVLVANLDSLAARTVTLRTALAPGARLLAAGATPAMAIEPLVSGARISLHLEAGDFALLELAPARGPGTVGVTPNPAADRIAFSLGPAARAASLEILDAGGRRVWVRSIAAGEALVWTGERDGGGRAPAGVYFARVTGPGSVDGRTRFVWLGSR